MSGFRFILVGFFSWPRGLTVKHFSYLQRTKYRKGTVFNFFSLNVTDIHSSGDSHKILELVYVKYVLSMSGLILKPVATFVQKVGLI